MATIAQLRAGLATSLGTIKDVQISAYVLASPTPPTIWVYPAEHSYHEASLDGHTGHVMTVEAVVSRNADVGQQVVLDELLAVSGARSVKAALEADLTLGGICQDLTVRSAGGYTPINVEGQGPFLSVSWRVEIFN